MVIKWKGAIVISILWAWAVALLLLGSGIPRGHNREMRCKAVMKGLEIGIKGYKTEYLKLPEVAVASDTTVLASGGELLSILLAENKAKNEREIRFWEPPPSKSDGAGAAKNAIGEWELRDPWGKNFYHIRMDVDGDGRIPNPAGGAVPDEPGDIVSDVIVYSAGPDGDFATWKDNVASWR